MSTCQWVQGKHGPALQLSFSDDELTPEWRTYLESLERKQMKTIELTRIELNWLYRQLLSGKDRASGIIKTFTGPLSEDRNKELNEAQAHFDELEKLTTAIKDRLDAGDLERLKLNDLRTELEEALELAPSSAVEIRKRLDALPKEAPYMITFDRETIKFTLKLVEKDLEKFRVNVIPNYEKASDKDFTDPIQTKEFWINKARKSKTILEILKSKLEKAL